MNGRATLEQASGPISVPLVQKTSSPEVATAFDAIFIEHYPRVVAIIARLVADRSRAEQLAADVFWKLYRRAARKQHPNIGGWLYRAALHVGLDALRVDGRRARREAAAAVERLRESYSSDPLADILLAERQAQVRATLARLKPRQARLLLLRGGAFSYQEIADILKLNPRSVGTLLARAEEAFERQHRELHGSKS